MLIISYGPIMATFSAHNTPFPCKLCSWKSSPLHRQREKANRTWHLSRRYIHIFIQYYSAEYQTFFIYPVLFRIIFDCRCLATLKLLYKILWSLRAWAANDLRGKLAGWSEWKTFFLVFFSLIFTGREFTLALPNPSSYPFFSPSYTNNIICCEERLHFTSTPYP